ncbi:DUF4355 domain-containing protein [Clostridium sp. FS41]|uniref:DUF4355 domain-containing protein n=1 Tax=Clostridium sp. FS41 TaxID=1609975 RepID=UPI0005D423C1|nr:DUF4355 domain-containing protein [Clostridium sp. FS41]KJJ66697.1 hypothetical protein CLFS41_50660 [Clostridium sp. FS41]
MRTELSRERVPMNLQLFAASGDGAGAGGGNGDGVGTEGENGGTSGDEGEKENPPSFDDLLKDGHQAEFDRRMQKGIETALAKAQEKWKVLTDDKLSEAEKLAKMTKEEKALYLQQKHEKALAAREADITRRELMAEAKNTLAEKKLPVGLAEVLNYTDAESCNKSMVAVEKAFQEAVQAAVEEKLKGGTPPKKAPTGGDDDLAKQVENLMMGSI